MAKLLKVMAVILLAVMIVASVATSVNATDKTMEFGKVNTDSVVKGA